eukprot:1159255-Pelagomonas_calceolata.AAC.9
MVKAHRTANLKICSLQALYAHACAHACTALGADTNFHTHTHAYIHTHTDTTHLLAQLGAQAHLHRHQHHDCLMRSGALGRVRTHTPGTKQQWHPPAPTPASKPTQSRGLPPPFSPLTCAHLHPSYSAPVVQVSELLRDERCRDSAYCVLHPAADGRGSGGVEGSGVGGVGRGGGGGGDAAMLR